MADKRPYSEFMAALAMAGCEFPQSFYRGAPIRAQQMAEATPTSHWGIVGNADTVVVILTAFGIEHDRDHDFAYGGVHVGFTAEAFRKAIDLDR